MTRRQAAPPPIAWPRRRPSVARRFAGALVFVWISLAVHVLLFNASRREGCAGKNRSTTEVPEGFTALVARALRLLGSAQPAAMPATAAPIASAAPVGTATVAPVGTVANSGSAP